MADERNIGKDINAMGYGPQDLRDADGGNNSRGALDQVRPTGILATGNKREAGGYSMVGGDRAMKSNRKRSR